MMQCPNCGYVAEAVLDRWWCERCFESYDVRPDEEDAARVARQIQNCILDQHIADDAYTYEPVRSRYMDEEPGGESEG